MLYAALAAALLLTAAPAYAQMYSWKDPGNGETKLSNIAPPWYTRDASVSGPRVIKTVNGKVVDDTGLAYEDRLLLSGKSREDIEKLRLQKIQGSPTQRDSIRDTAKSDAQPANRHATEATRSGVEAARKKGS